MSAGQLNSELIVSARKQGAPALSLAWIVPVLAALPWILLIWLVHRNSPRTLVSFHGLLHAAIAGEFLSTSVPGLPENPFYAGEPLAYYWFFQYVAAQVTRISGLNIFYSFELLVIVATACLVVAGVFLGRRLYHNTLSGVFLSFLIIAGVNPFGWVYLVYQLARKGPGILADRGDYLWGVVHPIYSLIRYADVGGLYGPLLNFFLNITSRPIALASLLLVVLSLERFLSTRRRIAWLSITGASALTAALSPIIGIAGCGVLLLNLAALWLWRRLNQAEFERSDLPGPSACLALLVGLALAAPTYYHLVFGPSASGMEFGSFSIEDLRKALTVTFAISLLITLAVIGFLRTQGKAQTFLGILIGSALLLLVVTLAIRLPAANESNLFHAAVVLIAVPAAGAIVRRRIANEHPRARLALYIGVVLICLPTTFLQVAAYLGRPSVPVNFQAKTVARSDHGSDLSQLYQWAISETDLRAIFIVDPGVRMAVCGNTLEFPAMTRRAVLTEGEGHYIAEAYRDAPERLSLAVRLTSGEHPGETDIRFLSRFKRPVYILTYDSSSFSEELKGIYGPPLFQAGAVAVYKWPPDLTKPFSTEVASLD